MRIVCQQTILMKYHALFVIFEKSGKIWNFHLLQIIGGASRVNTDLFCLLSHDFTRFSSDKPYRQQSKLQRHKRATGYMHRWVELTIFVVCYTRLLMFLDSLFCKQQLVTILSRIVEFFSW